MKVHGIAVCYWAGGSGAETKEGDKPIILAQVHEVSDVSWLQRSTVRQVLTAVTRIFVQRCKLGDRIAAVHEGQVVHVHRTSAGLAAVVITDEEYPSRVAFHLASQLITTTQNKYANDAWKQLSENGAKLSELDEAIVQYQDPKKVDSISRVQGELDETMDIMRKNIDKVLDRGVALDDLMARSDDLSSNSKLFYNTARSHNRCCTIS